MIVTIAVYSRTTTCRTAVHRQIGPLWACYEYIKRGIHHIHPLSTSYTQRHCKSKVCTHSLGGYSNTLNPQQSSPPLSPWQHSRPTYTHDNRGCFLAFASFEDNHSCTCKTWCSKPLHTVGLSACQLSSWCSGCLGYRYTLHMQTDMCVFTSKQPYLPRLRLSNNEPWFITRAQHPLVPYSYIYIYIQHTFLGVGQCTQLIQVLYKCWLHIYSVDNDIIYSVFLSSFMNVGLRL